ncbi:MAG: NUDIX hydrolase [Herpetosiphonaceae bacterium]|nr:NUDIX hydrolase [Herpetosiphonaceae bacterium]
MPLEPWKTLARRTILRHSKFLTVESHIIQLPDGHIISDWAWLLMPDFVNVLPLTIENTFLCFRQTKYSVHGVSLAPVGGMLEGDEAPLPAAQRELLEETGYEASEWIDLGQYQVDGNRGGGIGYMFLAKGARRIGEANADDLEDQVLLELSRADLEAALLAGEFKVLSWATVVALALVRLGL